MPMVVILEVMDWGSLVNTTVNVAYSFNVQIQRLDGFNSAKIFGKLIKVLLQLYMKGKFSKKGLVKGS